MNNLVIIGANDFQNQLILKAKSLGYTTHVFAWAKDAIGKSNADHYYDISIIEKEKILSICKDIKPAGICSIASDLATITVNYVAESLNLPCNKTKYSIIQTNKYEMRKALSLAGIACPKFVLADVFFNKELLQDFKFPVIVKPTDRSGSRSIMKLESLQGMEEAVKSACAVSFEQKAIIEEYLDGDEYSMETITQNGVHRYLATTKKHTTGSPHYIETGHVQPSGLSDEIIEKAKETVFKAMTALHIENSAGHSEFKVDTEGNVSIIEIGARMGGDCIGSDLVYLSTGNDFMKMVIDISVGNKLEPIVDYKKTAKIQFLLTKNDLEELEIIRNTKPESLYRISDIDYENLGKVIDSSTRLGYYIMKGTV